MPNIFFVSQGQTGEQELPRSYLWAPLRELDGSNNFSYELIQTVQKDDVIIHYYRGSVNAISFAIADAFRCNKPQELEDWVWALQGTRVRLQTFTFPDCNNLQRNSWKEYFLENQPQKNGPLTRKGTVKQAYLSNANSSLLSKILSLAFESTRNQPLVNQLRSELQNRNIQL